MEIYNQKHANIKQWYLAKVSYPHCHYDSWLFRLFIYVARTLTLFLLIGYKTTHFIWNKCVYIYIHSYWGFLKIGYSILPLNHPFWYWRIFSIMNQSFWGSIIYGNLRRIVHWPDRKLPWDLAINGPYPLHWCLTLGTLHLANVRTLVAITRIVMDQLIICVYVY